MAITGVHIRRGMLLIVDDDPEAAATRARRLRLEGYDVVTACREGGWRAIATSRPDAILVDLAMPPIDRDIFLQRICAYLHVRHAAIAVITVDNFRDDELDVELDALTAVVCFKPLGREDFVRITDHLLA